MVSGIFDCVFQGDLWIAGPWVCLCGLGHVLNVPYWSSPGAGGFSLYYDSTLGGLCRLCFRGRALLPGLETSHLAQMGA